MGMCRGHVVMGALCAPLPLYLSWLCTVLWWVTGLCGAGSMWLLVVGKLQGMPQATLILLS